MVSKTHILLAVGLGLLLIGVSAPAQDEQWLQYHSARELGLLGGGMQPQPLEISSEKPLGVGLPQFKVENPFFAKWPTPMAKNGTFG